MADTTTTNFGLTKPGNLDASGAGLWGPKLNTNFDNLDAYLSRPNSVHNAPVVGATTTLDCSLARDFEFTVSMATTIAITNVPPSVFSTSLRCVITNGGAFLLSWPASVTWVSGAAPRFSGTGVNVVDLITKDGGTTWYGAARGDGLARTGSAANAGRQVQTLYVNGGLTSVVVADTSLASYSLPALTMDTNFQRVRISIAGSATTQQIITNIKFGATAVSGLTVAAGNRFTNVITITRTGAATQTSIDSGVNNGVATTARTTPAETLSGAVTIDFRASVTAGGTATFDQLCIEYLAA